MASSRIEFPKLWISSHRSSGLVFCLNSDSLGLLTLKGGWAPSGLRLPAWAVSRWCGGLGGVGVSVVSHKCFGGFGGVSVVSQWYLGGVRAVSGDVLVESWWRPWCLGGVSVVSQRLPCWFKVFTVSWLYLGGVRVGGVGAVVLVVCWLCHAPGSLQRLHVVVMTTTAMTATATTTTMMMTMMMMMTTTTAVMMMLMTMTMTTTKTMTMWRRPCVCRFELKWGEGRILTYVMK